MLSMLSLWLYRCSVSSQYAFNIFNFPVKSCAYILCVLVLYLVVVCLEAYSTALRSPSVVLWYTCLEADSLPALFMCIECQTCGPCFEFLKASCDFLEATSVS